MQNKLRACVKHGAYRGTPSCPRCYEEAPTADSISLVLANGEAIGAHWIYKNKDMADWYVKNKPESDSITYSFIKGALRKPGVRST